MEMTLDEISSTELLLAFLAGEVFRFLMLMKDDFILEGFVTVVTKWQ